MNRMVLLSISVGSRAFSLALPVRRTRPREIDRAGDLFYAIAKYSKRRGDFRRARLHSFGDCGDRIDLVGVESEPLLDYAHLVVRLFIRPDRVLRVVLQGVVRRRALEGAIGFMPRADETVHLHVLAREIIDDRVVAFFYLDRVPGVGDELAVEL